MNIAHHAASDPNPLIYLGFPLIQSTLQHNSFIAALIGKLKKKLQPLSAGQCHLLGKPLLSIHYSCPNAGISFASWHIQQIPSVAIQFLKKGISPVIPWKIWTLPRSQWGLGIQDVNLQYAALYFRWISPLLQLDCLLSTNNLLLVMLTYHINNHNCSSPHQLPLLFPVACQQLRNEECLSLVWCKNPSICSQETMITYWSICLLVLCYLYHPLCILSTKVVSNCLVNPFNNCRRCLPGNQLTISCAGKVYLTLHLQCGKGHLDNWSRALQPARTGCNFSLSLCMFPLQLLLYKSPFLLCTHLQPALPSKTVLQRLQMDIAPNQFAKHAPQPLHDGFFRLVLDDTSFVFAHMLLIGAIELCIAIDSFFWQSTYECQDLSISLQETFAEARYC